MLQLVPERKTALKNRAHLDFLVDDVAAATAQVVELGGRALAVAQLQPGHVGIVLVGDEHLEAVPVGVGERQLGAGMGVLAAADRPSPLRPAGQVEACKLGDLGAVAFLAVGVDRRLPGIGGMASTAARTRSSAGRLIENPNRSPGTACSC